MCIRKLMIHIFEFRKILVLRTHPEEQHDVKSAANTEISTICPQWNQQMLTKCYLKWQWCSCDFQRIKVWPFGVPKPCRISSYDALSLLIKSTCCVKKPGWYIGILHDNAFWAPSSLRCSPARSEKRSLLAFLIVNSLIFGEIWYLFILFQKLGRLLSHRTNGDFMGF